MEKNCPKCDSPMTFKQGVKKETGKPWNGYFCQNQACKNVEWGNSRPATQKPNTGHPGASGNEEIMKSLRELYKKLDYIEKFLVGREQVSEMPFNDDPADNQ